MRDEINEFGDHFDQMLSGKMVTESAMKQFVQALGGQERAIADSTVAQELQDQLTKELTKMIDGFVISSKTQIDSMVSAVESADTNETAESSKNLRRAFGALVTTSDGQSVAVAERKAKTTAASILRGIVNASLDDVSARYSG